MSSNRTPIPAPPPSTMVVQQPTFRPDDLTFIFEEHLSAEHRLSMEVVAFIRSYLVCRDVRQASKAAGIATLTGQALLRKKDVHSCIAKITEAAVFKYGLDPEELVQKVKEIAQVDPVELQNEDGTFKERLADIDPETRRAIKKMVVKNEYGEDINGMRIVTGKIITIEFWDKLKSAELLGRETGQFKETKKIEHDVSKNMKETLLAARDRAEMKAIESREKVIDVTPVTESPMKGSVVNSIEGKRPFPKPPGVV